MTGRKPKPKALKLLDGNPGKQSLNYDEIQAKPAAPPVPEVLSGRAKEHWDFLVAELTEMGIMGNVDGGLLMSYCMALAQMEECQRAIDRDGMVLIIRNDKGEVKSIQQSPHVKMSRNLMTNIKSMASELGLSATARVRLKSSKPQSAPVSKFAEFLSA